MWPFRKKPRPRYLRREVVNLQAYLDEREIICNLLNQIAHASREEFRHVVRFYGGSSEFANELYDSCRRIIRNVPPE